MFVWTCMRCRRTYGDVLPEYCICGARLRDLRTDATVPVQVELVLQEQTIAMPPSLAEESALLTSTPYPVEWPVASPPPPPPLLGALPKMVPLAWLAALGVVSLFVVGLAFLAGWQWAASDSSRSVVIQPPATALPKSATAPRATALPIRTPPPRPAQHPDDELGGLGNNGNRSAVSLPLLFLGYTHRQQIQAHKQHKRP